MSGRLVLPLKFEGLASAVQLFVEVLVVWLLVSPTQLG